jgi:FKBP-type peptidyl-prolyl cis-trans isomerase
MSKRGLIAIAVDILAAVPVVTILLVSPISRAGSTATAADMKEPEGSVTTKSGLKYLDLKVGTGKEAQSGKTVVVDYIGALTDGMKFDSTVDHSKVDRKNLPLFARTPFDFKLGTGVVIKGWDEGVPGMKVGGKRRLFIPHRLAYGKLGCPPLIPANADLIFEIELLEVK